MRAIIGPNGAGKTTMMDVVTGKTRPDTGDVMFDGLHNLTRLDEAEIAELGIGRKFQKPTVFESHTVFDNIELALKSDRRARSALWWRETADERRRIDELLEHHPPDRGARPSCRAASRTGSGNGSKSACCWRRIRSCFWSTSRSPA